ncbi:MAG: ATP-dependent helicase [Methylobacterium sp.]|uniref:ATP-dependent helicase n=1 Tax=Methylobacterium sp. TaxID=409 RepID=UPI000FB1B311|nr:ATP-dependent helicase [Methylobacterium sp.]RUP14661.1 MAG: ATP-dependent helicase [Methylobacterium sp.]
MTDSIDERLKQVESALQAMRSELFHRERVDAAMAEHREAAVRIVLASVIASLGWWGLDRKKFKALIASAAQKVPNYGPASVRHEVLYAEARKVLGKRD